MGEPLVRLGASEGRPQYRSIFTDASARERAENFEDYFAFTRARNGALLQADRDLATKREILRAFRAHPVRSARPLADPEVFYKNQVIFRDDPRTVDRRTLLFTAMYKVARHEWVGISAAWDVQIRREPLTTIDKITLYHLAEEFCHMRFFDEIFRTGCLDRVTWVPLSPLRQQLYRLLPRIPDVLLDPPAFVTELLGITIYRHVDALLDELYADEPEARQRIRALLHEIMVDELAHIGHRRNFLGPTATRMARRIVAPLFRAFLRDIPESRQLFDVDRMIAEALAFDYSGVPAHLLARTWVPRYCRIG
jgi:hypothetical protein